MKLLIDLLQLNETTKVKLADLQLNEANLKAKDKKFIFYLDASDREEIEASIWAPFEDKAAAEEFVNSEEVLAAIDALKMLQNKDLSIKDFYVDDAEAYSEKGVKGWTFYMKL